MTPPEFFTVPPPVPIRRRGKEWRERIAACALLVPGAPLIALCALAIKAEGLLHPDARGPVLFREDRISRGRVIRLLKFRTLPVSTLSTLGAGPSHIGPIERAGGLTRTGRVIHRWYLDELPQLWNIVRGDMFLIGTRPYPIELYEQELAAGITRKRDMPAGLVGPVQASKGDSSAPDGVLLDAQYWEAFRNFSGVKLLLLDLHILGRSARVQLQHKGL